MADKNMTAVAPKLRFPGWRKPWNQIQVSNFFDLRSKSDKTETFNRARLLTVKLHGNGVVKNEKATLTGGANYFTRRSGQFIFSKIDLLNGAFGIVPEELDGFSSSSDVPAYSFKADQSSTFFLYWLRAHYQHLAIERTGTSSTLKRVSPERFLALSLFVPCPAEQQKIAGCLASLDKLIGALHQKVKTLETYKRGLVQQLFPRNGEAVPRRRFPKFSGTPDWKRERLSSVAEFLKGKGIAKADLDPNGKILCIRYGELYTRYSEKIEIVHSRTSIPEHELFLSRKNDVIIPASGETKLDIATASCVLIEGVALGSDLNVLRTAQDGVFLSYYLNGPKRLEIARLAQGDAVVHLYPSQLAQLEIALPEKGEQQNIAMCLASLDSAIDAESKKLDALKIHKKGLLQELLAAPEQV